MNATQSKQVLSLLNEAIAMMPHETTLQLRVRLAQVTAPSVKRGTVELPNGKTVIDDLADPFGAHEKKGAINYASYWCSKQLGIATGAIVLAKPEPFDKQATMDRLSICACGHKAHVHAKDELENLLQCAGCECQAFHYDNEEQRAA